MLFQAIWMSNTHTHMPTAVHRWLARPLSCTIDWVRVRHAGLLVYKTWQGSPTRCRTRATHLTSLGRASGRDPGGSLQSAQFQQHLAPGALQDHSSTHVDAHTCLALWPVFLLISSQTHFHILSRTFIYMQRPDATTQHLV